MSEKFCLKWNDFQSNVSNSFSLLRNEDYLHDVTIVTDDNEQVAAHKLILSACSEFFKNIFKKNKHPNPFLCLEGVSSKDFRNVMDYMYNGEVNIFQEDLHKFLNVAQRLKLEVDAEQEVEVNVGGNESFERKEIHNREIFSRYETKLKPNPERHEKIIAKNSTDMNPENLTEVNEQIIQNIVKNSDGTYSCKICGKNSGKQMGHMKNHVETHLEGLCYNCPMCERTFRSRPSLIMHKRRNH